MHRHHDTAHETRLEARANAASVTRRKRSSKASVDGMNGRWPEPAVRHNYSPHRRSGNLGPNRLDFREGQDSSMRMDPVRRMLLPDALRSIGEFEFETAAIGLEPMRMLFNPPPPPADRSASRGSQATRARGWIPDDPSVGPAGDVCMSSSRKSELDPFRALLAAIFAANKRSAHTCG